MDQKAALEKVIAILPGGQSELERRLKQLGRKIRQQSISLWLAGGLPEGKDWALWISRTVDFEVTPHELDKSAYPNPWDGLPLERARPLIEERAVA